MTTPGSLDPSGLNADALEGGDANQPSWLLVAQMLAAAAVYE
jgi:hypothetical protein